MILKIISGGQTGVDRAALDFAIRSGIEHGGWCPQGRLAEDGLVPSIYQLRETDTPDYSKRTERNVVDSDATLIITRDAFLTGGTALTQELALRHSRPLLVLQERDGVEQEADRLAAFFKQHPVKVLNIAGPRESEAPRLGLFVGDVLTRALRWFKQ